METGQAPVAGVASPLSSLAWLERRLSLPLVFGVLAAATFLIAWNRGIALLYALFALLVAAVLLSILGPRLMLRAASVRIDMPSSASVGDTVTIGVTVVPKAWPRKRHMLYLPAPYPFAPGHGLFLPVAGDGVERRLQVPVRRRGVFRMCEAEVVSAYPFGLATVQRTWPAESQQATVYPRVYGGNGLAWLRTAAHGHDGTSRASAAAGEDLFREIREYRRGDNPRHIHWKGSARRGEFVVRQFDALAADEFWIVLDLDPASHAGSGEDHSFERAVELAASVATQCIRAGLRCGLAGGVNEDGSPALLLMPHTGQAHLRAMMDALAVVQADCSVPYARVLDSLIRYGRRGQRWILFDHGGTEKAPALQRLGCALFWFRFDMETFTEDDRDAGKRASQPPAWRSDGVTVGHDTDFEKVFDV